MDTATVLGMLAARLRRALPATVDATRRATLRLAANHPSRAARSVSLDLDGHPVRVVEVDGYQVVVDDLGRLRGVYADPALRMLLPA